MALKTEEGGQEPRKAGGLLKLEKARKQTTSLLPKRGTVLLTPDFSSERPTLDFLPLHLYDNKFVF